MWCVYCTPLDLPIDTNQLPVEWTWRKSQVLHERGTKHKTQLFEWSLSFDGDGD